MPKNKISEFSSTPANNTDIGGIDIAEGCAPSGINNAIRELMAQLKDQQAGTDGDSQVVGGNLTVSGNLTVNGTTTLTTALPVTSGGTGASTASNARTNLGLGTIATQDANNVAVTGGSLNVGSVATGVRPLQVTGATSAESTLYVSSGLADNRIWNFLVNCQVGGASGFNIRKLNDAGTSGSIAFSIDTNLNATVGGSMTATSFSGAGTGLTGNANSLNAGIGVNQTWQNVTGSRALNTVYTNSTGKPIQVCVGVFQPSGSGFVFQINSSTVSNDTAIANGRTLFQLIIPNGATYAVVVTAGSPSLTLWSELR